MGYVIYKIQNVSNYSKEKPTIVIKEGDPGWEEALACWKDGKNPTDSKFWKKGIIALTKPIQIGHD